MSSKALPIALTVAVAVVAGHSVSATPESDFRSATAAFDRSAPVETLTPARRVDYTTTPTVPTTTTTTTTIPTGPTTIMTPTTTRSIPLDGSEIILIGDSLCVLSTPEIHAAAVRAGIREDLGFDCEGGRSPVEGWPVLEALTIHPAVLVVELGTNPGEQTASIGVFDDIIAEFSDSEIYFVTSARQDPTFQVFLDQLNDHTVEQASLFSHVHSCDWATIVAANEQWYDDGVHYDAAGELAFGDYLVSCMLGRVSPTN